MVGNLLGFVHVVGAALLEGERFLVALRSTTMADAGLWEFPGGKVEAGESPEDALVREIREELGCVIRPLGILGREYSQDKKIVLDVYLARLASGTPVAREHEELRWVDMAEARGLDWASADLPLLPQLDAWLRAASGPRAKNEEADGKASDDSEIKDSNGVEEVTHECSGGGG